MLKDIWKKAKNRMGTTTESAPVQTESTPTAQQQSEIALRYDPREDLHGGTLGISGISTPRERLESLQMELGELTSRIKRRFFRP